MDWLNFIASLFKAIAWPCAAVAIVLMLRRTLNQILPDLKRLRIKNIELEFESQVAKAKAEIESTTTQKVFLENSMQHKNEIEYYKSLAEVSPRAAVLEAWHPFEMEASKIAETIGIAKPGVPLQMPQLIEGLKREGILKDDEAKAVTRLRAVRNEVVHGPSINLPVKSIAEFSVVLQELTHAMRNRVELKR
ncbi:MAG: hypothetical protein MUP71_10640 [Candidatus Aminicenantes bacterium]|nr:hypothetical protein [Candidatus Aminicenantes bacterium]